MKLVIQISTRSFLVALAVWVSAPDLCAGVLRMDFTVLAATGEPTPSPSNSYRFLSRPAINNQGIVSFEASLNGPGSRGVFSGTSRSNLAAIATGRDLGLVVMPDENSRVGYSGNNGFSLSSPSVPLQYATNGAQVPGATGDVRYDNLVIIDGDGRFRVARDGTVAFASSLVGADVQSNNSVAIFAGAAENLKMVARQGDPAAGVPGAMYSLNSTFVEVTAGSGESVAFTGTLTGDEVTTSNSRAIWAGTADGVDLLARQGDPAPGLPEGTTFGNQISPPRLNGNGEVVFESNFFGAERGRGMWRGTPDNLELVYKSTDPAPESPTGQLGNFRDPVLNDRGDVAFRSLIPGAGSGLWSDGSGELELLALQDERVGVIPGDVVFDRLDNLVLNNRGETAFLSRLSGTDVAAGTNTAIFLRDMFGDLELVVRAGDQLDVASGDIRTLSSLFFIESDTAVRSSGSDDGFSRGLNDLGQIAFLAIFDDGTEAIVVTPASMQVPEPSTGTLFAIGALLSAALRGRRRKSF